MFITIINTYQPIQEIPLKNQQCLNCKKSGNLIMILYQLHTNNGFIYKVSKKVTGAIHCESCSTDIPAIKWTNDIEAIFTAAKKQAPIEKPTKIYKWPFKFLMIVIGIIAISILYFSVDSYLSNSNKKNILKNPKVGNMFNIHYMERTSLQKYNTQGFTWVRIKEIKKDTLIMQFYKDLNITSKASVDLSEHNFNGSIFNAKKNSLQTEEKIDEFPRNGNDYLGFQSTIYKYKE
ncbi:hypothetical protein [Aquimarina sp. I32.4]|uniref:hypothetical protein n=1 Tax=Aquimarina sp. I32.4 TaxID=2053903 RepID=UPI000CDEE34B|nr:hypothetical protein [Aquimarina sp. I32.4]